jgi:hypothetical protein
MKMAFHLEKDNRLTYLQVSLSAIFRVFLIIFTLLALQSPLIVFASEHTGDKEKTNKLHIETDSHDKNKVQAPPIPKNKKPSPSKALKETKPETNHDKMLRSKFLSLIKFLKEYAESIVAIATLFTALVALYLGDFKARIRKPRLKLYFREKKEQPYFHKLSSGGYRQPIDLIGQIIYILKPVFTARVKIYNKGKSTALRVQAKIIKIEFKESDSNSVYEKIYHPTTVKWSGERDWNPVDIVPKSHFFLDLFWSKNETSSEVINFNYKKYREEFDKDILTDIVQNDINPSDEVYWNVWVDTSYDRGIAPKHNFQGEITIYFIVNGENCDPLKFEALINWSFETWNQPEIKIRQYRCFRGRRSINNG